MSDSLGFADGSPLQVEAEGFRPSIVAVELPRGLSEAKVRLPPPRLTPKDGGVRLLFGGDVSLGRRFLDPSEQTPRDRVPEDHPDALIRASDPLPGTKEVFTHIRPFFQVEELRVVNLETPVTDAPKTPHGSKDFAFFTLPGSLPALKWLGVDYVSLGNNHVYDYLAPGLEDTLRHVTAAGFSHSGAADLRDSARVAATPTRPCAGSWRAERASCARTHRTGGGRGALPDARRQ